MKKIIPAFFLSILVSACDGGGGNDNGVNNITPPPPPVPNPNGIWDGTISVNNVGTFQLFALFYEGDFIAISVQEDTMYVGNYTFAGDQLSGEATVYELNGGATGTAEVDGVFSAQNQISLTHDLSDGGTGSISLFYIDRYERDSSLSTVAGNYAIEADSGYRLDVNIQSNGSLSGSASDGCQLDGAISILDPDFNLYDVSLELAACGPESGTYTGLAGLGDFAETNDLLTLALSNEDFVFVSQVLRQ